MSDTATSLRAQLVGELTTAGWLNTAEWQAAFRAVPREAFLRRFFRLDNGAYTAVDATDPEWLTLVYRNAVWPTQLDGDDSRWAIARHDAPIVGVPTSSSTMPSLMAVMLETLDIAAGHRILEIGTGTGYNAALLCHRVGQVNVTTVEVDPGLASRADQALADAGYHPTVVTADGDLGHSPGAPYDRLITTCSVPAIPTAWLAQLRPGGKLVTNLHRELHEGLLVQLTADGDGGGSGPIIDDDAYFMPTRTYRPTDTRAILRQAQADAGEDRKTDIPIISDDEPAWATVAALTMPGAARLDISRPDGDVQWLTHPDGSWAYREANRVEQGGPRRLWDQVEAAHAWWVNAQRPHRAALGLTVTANGRHTMWVGNPAGPSVNLD